VTHEKSGKKKLKSKEEKKTEAATFCPKRFDRGTSSVKPLNSR
jgi:hypothetical protein